MRFYCVFIFKLSIILYYIMCVIIAGETQPDTTKLINIPVKLNGNDNSYNFFMYR